MPPTSDRIHNDTPLTMNAPTMAIVDTGRANAMRRRRPLVSAIRPPTMSPMPAGVPTAIENTPIIPPLNPCTSVR